MNKKTIITGSSIRYCQITNRFAHRIFWGCLLFATMLLLPIYHVLASESYAEIESASWQDSNTLVLMWADPGLYEVYRSGSPNSNYVLIGTSDSGFYVDNAVTYSDNTGNANEYYYRLGLNGVPVSAPVQSGYNSHDLSCVQIFMYHHFIPDDQVGSKEYSKDFLDYAITTGEFEQDLIFLKKNGFTTITSKELLEYIDGNAELPKKAVIISIDDGSLSVYRYAFPLLKKYDMKAEFNLIGKSIDDATEPFLNQESDVSDERTAEDYCNWYEILEMNESGLVSLTSHSYALHYYGQYGRIGALQADGEEETDYAEEMKRDYDTAYRCINGWLGINPTTFVYPYSKRNLLSDKILLEQTGYRILMAGKISERVTKGNYFVDGAPSASYMRVMTRIPRMTGTPLSQYISDVYASDAANGVNINIDISRVY